MQHNQSLLSRLEAFVKRYYMNKIIKGVLIWTLLCLSIYAAFVLIEYFFYLSPSIKTILIALASISILGLLLQSVLLPLLSYYNINRKFGYAEAAQFLGKHFPAIDDQIINVLQLQQEMQAHQIELIESAIAQKNQQLSKFNFNQAIDFRLNKRFVYYLSPLVLGFLLVIAIAPNILSESTERIINYSKAYSKPAPFQFIILNEALEVNKNESFTLEVKLEGDVLPNELFFVSEKNTFNFSASSIDSFQLDLNNVQEDIPFRLFANGFYSDPFLLKTIKKPFLSNLSLVLRYPSYTKKSAETLKGLGDASIPEGTKIEWNVSGDYVDEVYFQTNENRVAFNKNEASYSYSNTCKQSFDYTIFGTLKKYVSDTLKYHIEVIKDAYPSIQLNQIQNEFNASEFGFNGFISDDYGLRSLFFVCINEQNTIRKSIPINQLLQENFSYIVDFSSLEIEAGKDVQYYFEVFDNDGINGSKSTKSSVFTYHQLSKKEQEQQESEQSTKIQSDLDKAIDKTKESKEITEKLLEQLLNKKNLDFKDKAKLEQLLKEQEKIKENIESLKQNTEKLSNQNYSPEQNEKQEKFEELLDKMLDKQNQEILEEIKKNPSMKN
jgi:hypothetical protein